MHSQFLFKYSALILINVFGEGESFSGSEDTGEKIFIASPRIRIELPANKERTQKAIVTTADNEEIYYYHTAFRRILCPAKHCLGVLKVN